MSNLAYEQVGHSYSSLPHPVEALLQVMWLTYSHDLLNANHDLVGKASLNLQNHIDNLCDSHSGDGNDSLDFQGLCSQGTFNQGLAN